MEITIKLGEPLGQIVGRSQISFELPEGTTVSQALDRLGAAYPSLAATLAGDSNRPAVGFQYFVNRKWVRDEELAQHRLKARDRLYILAPTVGG